MEVIHLQVQISLIIALKKHTVYGISRSKEPKNYFLKYKNKSETKKNFFFYRLDLNKDFTKIIRLIKKIKPTYIVNFASQSMVAQSWKYPMDWYQTNVISSIKLIEHLSELKFFKKYIHASTPEVYGSTKKNLIENVDYNPTTPYAISRACFDAHAMQLYKIKNFPIIFTRAANVYGPGQKLYRIIPRAIYSSFTNIKLNLDGGGLSKRSFIYIDDTVEATYKIAIRGNIGQIYHISNNKLISILDLVKKIFKICNSNFEKKVKIAPERKGKDKIYSLSNSKIKRELNWKPKTTISSGIKNTLEWFLQNKKALIKEKIYYDHSK